MNEYLAIINRYEFAQFYRHSYMFIGRSELLPIQDINSNKTKEDIIGLFFETTPFDYDEEYLIINLTYNSTIKNSKHLFNIEDVKAIYPLSLQAKLSIEDRIDTRIKLENPIFESILPRIIDNTQQREVKLGVEGLWKIFNLEGSYESTLNKINAKNIIDGLEYRKKGVFASKILDGNVWSVLLAYERYEFYPNTYLGYFFDMNQIFAISKNKQDFSKSSLYSFLKQQKEGEKLSHIIKNLENSEMTKGFINQTNLGGLNFHIIAPLFLMIKNDFRENDDLESSKYLEQSHVEYLKKQFGDDFKAVVILLGAFFGFKKIYDAYYNRLNLRFYKDYKPQIRTKKALEVETINKNGGGISEKPKKKVVEELDISTPTTSEEVTEQEAKTNVKQTEADTSSSENETKGNVKQAEAEIPSSESEEAVQAKAENKTNTKQVEAETSSSESEEITTNNIDLQKLEEKILKKYDESDFFKEDLEEDLKKSVKKIFTEIENEQNSKMPLESILEQKESIKNILEKKLNKKPYKVKNFGSTRVKKLCDFIDEY